jgi:ketosteroid isomerase-like protein
MAMNGRAVSGAAIKRAIEGREGRMLGSFYADDAVVRVIDHNNPPSRPREIKGRAAIDAFWDDICSRDMTHKVDVTIADEDQLAFSQACTYPDGAKVYLMSLLALKEGRIVHQTIVQAWDE